MLKARRYLHMPDMHVRFGLSSKQDKLEGVALSTQAIFAQPNHQGTPEFLLSEE